MMLMSRACFNPPDLKKSERKKVHYFHRQTKDIQRLHYGIPSNLSDYMMVNTLRDYVHRHFLSFCQLLPILIILFYSFPNLLLARKAWLYSTYLASNNSLYTGILSGWKRDITLL